MKLHEKINLEKDEDGLYKEHFLEYYDYKLYSHKDGIRKIIDIFDNSNNDIVSREALQYFYKICEEMPFNQALEGIDYACLCESPIELLFYFCFCYIMQEYKIKLYLMIQEKIEVENKEYRVDFKIIGEDLPKDKKAIIECDGYEYHSSTKQQAKDNQRQRDLENDGYIVIRFSGSEIYNDTIKCVYETLKRLDIEIGVDN